MTAKKEETKPEAEETKKAPLPLLDMDALIEGSAKLEFVTLEIPEVGGSVNVAYLDGKARDQFDNICNKRTDKTGKITNLIGLKKELVAASLVNPDGELMFSGKKADKVHELKGIIIDAVFDKSSEINKIGKKALDKAKKN